MKKAKAKLTAILMAVCCVFACLGVSVYVANNNALKARAEETYIITELTATNASNSSTIYAYTEEIGDETFNNGWGWGVAVTFIEESGAGIQLNSEDTGLIEVKKPGGDFYFGLGEITAEAGDVFTVGGAFISEAGDVFYFENCSLEFDGSKWVKPGQSVQYTDYNLGKLVLHNNSKPEGGAGTNNAQLHLASESGSADVDWVTKFTVESGEGVKINGQATSIRIVSPGDVIYLDLGGNQEPGTVVTVCAGSWILPEKAIRYNVEESKFVWNGTNWAPYVEYTEYNLGKLVLHNNSKSTGGAGTNNAQLHLASESGSANVDWVTKFTVESGEGIKINGQATSIRIVSPDDVIYLDLGGNQEPGTVVTVCAGSWILPEKAIRYNVEESEFVWNGTGWEPRIAVTNCVLGQLELHGNSTVGGAKGLNTELHLKRADGGEIPDLGWTDAFALVEGAFKVNGEVATLNAFKSPGAPGFIYITFDAVETGAVVSIEGTFACSANKHEYVIEESKFVWNGECWENYVQYDEYNLGTLTFHANSKGVASTWGYELYLISETTLPTLAWGDPAFTLESGAGMKVNGEVVTLTEVKSPEGFLYFKFDALTEEAVVTIEGTFVCPEKGVRYIIEESKFLWNGAKWEPYVEYTTYNLGELTFRQLHPGTTNMSYFALANGDDAPYSEPSEEVRWNKVFTLVAGTGVGVTINGETVNPTIKVPGAVFVEFASAPNANDELVIEGTYYNADLCVKYVIEESKFVWNGSAWETYVPPVQYTTYTMTKIGATGASTASVLYVYSAQGDGLPKDNGAWTEDWDNVYALEEGSGLGVTVNGNAVATEAIKLPGDLYLPLVNAVAEGDVLGLDGTFYNEAKAVKLVFEDCKLQWNGSTWVEYVPPIQYTTYELGKLTLSADSKAANHIYLLDSNQQNLGGANDWDEYTFTFEEGGMTLNGEPLVTTDVKDPGALFVGFGKDANVGGVFTIQGIIHNAEGVRYVIEESKFVWDGSKWAEYVPPIQYTTYELGKLTLSADSKAANHIYLLDSNQQNLGGANDWDEYTFTFEEGGMTLNGEPLVTTDVKDPGALFVGFGKDANVGGVFTIQGIIHNAEGVRYVIEESKFVWDGSKWAEYVPPVEYTDYNLGVLTFHPNSLGAVANANNQLHLISSDGVEIPDLTWEGPQFVLETGAGLKVNGEAVELIEIKSADALFFILFDAITEEAVVTIEGTFVCPSVGYRYIIEESTFVWNGSKWTIYAPSIEYTTYEIGKMGFSSVFDADKAQMYFNFEENIASSAASWDVSYIPDTDGLITLNGESIELETFKFNNVDSVFVDFDAMPTKDDVLVIKGTFYNEILASKIIIEESKFVWNGTAWILQIEYTDYDLGVLTFHANSTVGGAKGANNQLHLISLDEDVLIPDLTWEGPQFALESGYGLKVNGETVNISEVKSPEGFLFVKFNELAPNSVVSIEGTFICASEALRYIVAESKFVWTGVKWEPYVEYTTENAGKLEFVYASVGETAQFDFMRADGNAFTIASTENNANWETPFYFRLGTGVGITLNGEAVEATVKFPNNMFIEIASIAVGDVLVIEGTFYSSALAMEYVIERTQFVWNGTEFLSKLTLAKIEYKEQLDTYFSAFAQEDYYADEWAQLGEIVNTGKTAIDEATDDATAKAALDSAKAELDAVKTSEEVDVVIVGVRADAKAELAAYVNEADYKDAEWATIQGIIADVSAAIDASVSERDILAMVEEAKADIDEVKTAAEVDAEALATAKDEAKAEVRAYYNALDTSLYGDDANAQLTACVTEANAAIDAATTIEEVNAAVAEFKAKIDAVEKLPTEDNSSSNASGGCVGNAGSGLVMIPLFALAVCMIIRKRKEI